MRRAALVAAIALLAAPANAGATDATRADVAELARAAESEPTALNDLRSVTSVEGVPVDLDTALAGAEGSDLSDRLEGIALDAEATPPTGPDAAEARGRVADILADDDVKPPPPPEDSGDGALAIPGVSTPVLLLLAALIVVLAALAARGMGRQTILEREEMARRERGEVDGKARARDLDAEADAAERRGDFATAVRLRFQAGLKRLDELGQIDLRPSLTATSAARESGIPEIGGLASSYERVAFGERGASEVDASEQRSGWKAVIGQVRRRR